MWDGIFVFDFGGEGAREAGEAVEGRHGYDYGIEV